MSNYYTDALDREYRYQEEAEQSEIEREQMAAGTHYYDEATGKVVAKAESCCQQCDEIDAAHDPDELLRCEICGIDVEVDGAEPVEMDGGEVMACHACIVRLEGAKAEAAMEAHQQWLDDQITPTEYERLGRGGY